MASTAEVCELAREAVKVFQTTDDVDAIRAAKRAFDETKDIWAGQEQDARTFFRGSAKLSCILRFGFKQSTHQLIDITDVMDAQSGRTRCSRRRRL